MSKSSKRHFWEWFKRNNKEYLELNKKSKKEAAYWLNELNAHLRAYFKFFGYSLALQEKQVSTLTITVHGKTAHFKKVEALVATAPDIPGWRITALEDPKPIDFMLEKQIEEVDVHPDELYFSILGEEPGGTAIMVYHPLCTKENEHLFLQLADAAIFNLLGERNYGLEISWMDVTNLSYAEPDDVHRLEDLPECIGARKGSMVVDGGGKLLEMG